MVTYCPKSCINGVPHPTKTKSYPNRPSSSSRWRPPSVLASEIEAARHAGICTFVGNSNLFSWKGDSAPKNWIDTVSCLDWMWPRTWLGGVHRSSGRVSHSTSLPVALKLEITLKALGNFPAVYRPGGAFFLPISVSTCTPLGGQSGSSSSSLLLGADDKWCCCCISFWSHVDRVEDHVGEGEGSVRRSDAGNSSWFPSMRSRSSSFDMLAAAESTADDRHSSKPLHWASLLSCPVP